MGFYDEYDWPTKLSFVALLCMASLFIILSASLPRPIPCTQFKTNITQVNTSTLVGASYRQSPLICFPKITDENSGFHVNVSIRGGFFDNYDDNKLFPVFTIFNKTYNLSYTFPNATIYRHRCNDAQVIRRSGVYSCSRASGLLPYLAPPSNLTKNKPFLSMNLTVVNSEPCQKVNGTRAVPVIWEELLDVRINSTRPDTLCMNDPGTVMVTINGTGFLKITANKTVYQPTVFYNNVTIPAAVNVKTCNKLTVSNVTIQVCTQIQANLSMAEILLSEGYVNDNTLKVVNPEPCFTSFYSLFAAFKTIDMCSG